MLRSMRKPSTGRVLALSSLCGGLLAVAVTGCSPSTVTPVGATTSTITVTGLPSSLSSWGRIQSAIALGLQSNEYQEKVTVNVSEGSILGGFTVYGRINPPDKLSVAYHQNGYNMAFYQQRLSAYGEEDGHWQQVPALSELNLFPAYKRLVDDVAQSGIPIREMDTPQYVVDEYCNVFQASIPANLIQTLPVLSSSYHAGDMSSVLYTFYVGKKSGELRRVTTTSEGAVTGAGTVGISTDTLVFAINQSGSEISIDPNLYGALLYQY